MVIESGPGDAFEQAQFLDHVSIGRMRGARVFGKTGIRASLTGTLNDIWDGTGNVTLLTSAETLDVVSTSASDDLAGIGTRTLFLQGLDANYLEIGEVIVLDGLTPVTSTNSFLRINTVIGVTAGSNELNVGDIDITGTSSGTQVAFIVVGTNSAQQAHFSVPDNQVFFFKSASTSTPRSTNAEISNFVRFFGGALVSVGGASIFQNTVFVELSGSVVPPKADVMFRARALTGTGLITTSFRGYFAPSNLSDPNVRI